MVACFVAVFLVIAASFAAVHGNIYDYSALNLSDETVSLADYKSYHVLLVVNVASQCPFAQSKFKALNNLYDDLHSKGFNILGSLIELVYIGNVLL